MNWELVLQVVGAVIASIVAISQVVGRFPKSRNQLQRDLEILSMLDKEDPNYLKTKKYIDVSIERLYGTGPRRGSALKVNNWSDFITASLFLFFSVLATVMLTQDGFSWWALLTGFFTLCSITLIGGAFNEEGMNEASDETESKSQ